MNKLKSGLIKFGKFLKKNVYYVLIIVAVAAICTMVGVTVSRNKSNVNNDVPAVVTPENPSDDNKEPVKPDNPEDKKPVVEQIVFVTPVTGGTVAASFSETELVFSKTLEQWSTHRAVDFVAEEGSDVLAVWDGVVTAIDNDPLYGYCVSISHGDGLVSRYCGLSENVSVSVSQTVKKGAKIGEIGNTMIIENADGAHLHFETYKNGKLINPAEYFVADEK